MFKSFLPGLSGVFTTTTKPIIDVYGDPIETKKSFSKKLPTELWNEIFKFVLYDLEKCEEEDDNRCKLRKYDKNNQVKDIPCQKDISFLNLSQVNQQFRSFFLPEVWKSLTLNTIYSVQIYESFFSSTKNFKEIYGKHIKEIKFKWKCYDHCPPQLEPGLPALQSAFTKLNLTSSSSSKKRIQPNRLTNGPDGYGPLSKITSPASLQVKIEWIFRNSNNLEKLFWTATLMPFPKYLSDVLKKNCEKLNTFSLHDEISIPYSIHLTYIQPRSMIPFIDSTLKKVELLDCHFHGLITGPADILPWFDLDIRQPFGIRLFPQNDANIGAASPCWIMEQLILGAQNSLKEVVLSSHLILMIPYFIPLWIWFDSVKVESKEIHEQYIYLEPAAVETIEWLKIELIENYGKQTKLSLEQFIEKLSKQVHLTQNQVFGRPFTVSRKDLDHFSQSKLDFEKKRHRHLLLNIFKDIKQIRQSLEKVIKAKRNLIDNKDRKGK